VHTANLRSPLRNVRLIRGPRKPCSAKTSFLLSCSPSIQLGWTNPSVEHVNWMCANRSRHQRGTWKVPPPRQALSHYPWQGTDVAVTQCSQLMQLAPRPLHQILVSSARTVRVSSQKQTKMVCPPPYLRLPSKHSEAASTRQLHYSGPVALLDLLRFLYRQQLCAPLQFWQQCPATSLSGSLFMHGRRLRARRCQRE